MSSTIIIGVVVLYLLTMVGIGYYYREEAATDSGFLVADQRIGTIIGGGALAVTFISIPSLLGATAFSYEVGILWALFGGLGGVFSFFVSMYFIGPQLRDFEASTLPEYFEQRFGSKSHSLAAIIIALIMVVYLIAQLQGGAHVAQFVFDINFPTAVALVGAVFILYTALGGMYAVTITSFIQALMLVFGVLVVSVAGLANFGGWGGFLTEVQSEAGFYFTNTGRVGLEYAIGFGLLVFLSGLCSPHVIFRYFASKDPSIARDSAAVAAVFQGVFFALLVIPPAAAILLVPGLENTDQAYLAVADVLLADNPILLGLIFAGVLGAAMSTTDAMLINAASSLVYDLGGDYVPEAHQDRLTLYMRIVAIVIGIVVVGLTISPPAVILSLAIAALSLFIGAFLGPVLIGIWLDTRSDLAGATAMASGFLTVTVTHPATPIIQLSQDVYPGLLGAVVSTVLFLLVNYYADVESTVDAKPSD